MSDARPLEGLRVVEVGHGMAGSIVGTVLADFGADTVRIERGGAPHPCSRAPGWPVWRRGRRIVDADLRERPGRDVVTGLATVADVLVDAVDGGVEGHLGLADGELVRRNPRLVHCTISGFPPGVGLAAKKGYEGIVAAAAGRFANFGGIVSGARPVFSVSAVASFAASQLALHGIFAAVLVRRRTGRGQRVGTSLLEGLSVTGPGGWSGAEVFALLPYQSARTSDGRWIQFANTAPGLYRSMLRCLELEDVLDDDRFAAAPVLVAPEAVPDLRRRVLERVATRTLEDWMARFEADGNVGAEPYRTTREALTHPQLVADGCVLELDDPEAGRIRTIGPLVAINGTYGPGTGPAVPARAEDISWSLPEQAPTSGPAPAHPLAGTTIVELAGYMAAPLGPTLLADLGARVIKVEPIEGDPMRLLGGAPVAGNGVQGKESIAIDLKRPEGREILDRLIGRADVLIHNYRPGVPEKIGIDSERVRTLNPDLVYVWATAYGEDGPHARRPAFHPIPGAVCGGALRQAGAGFPPDPDASLDDDALDAVSRRLSLANEGSPDPCAALVVATAMLLGLLGRETGRGAHLTTSMLVSNAWVQLDDLVEGTSSPPLRPDDELLGLGALYRLYETSDGWLFLACVTDAEWEALVAGLDAEQLRDGRFSDMPGRRRHDAALAGTLSELLRSRTTAEWTATFDQLGVPCARADTGLFAGPLGAPVAGDELVALGLRVAVDTADGRYLRHAVGVRLSDTPGVARPGCALGEHTRPILAELGYSNDDIDRLASTGVVGTPA